MGSSFASAATPDAAALAVNALGLDLHRQMPPTGNVCLSPYSIQSALAMTYMGASGATQAEMAKVLHYPTDKAALGSSFAALTAGLAEATASSVKVAQHAKERGGPTEPIELRVANRLFGQKGAEFRPPFLAAVREDFGAPMEFVDFATKANDARRGINDWVANQTRQLIKDLIPKGGVNEDTRLVLVNALHLKAAWAEDFNAKLTKPQPFYAEGETKADVPMMHTEDFMGYAEGRGYQAVTLPYVGQGLQMLLIVPTKHTGLPKVEASLTPELLAQLGRAAGTKVILKMPKYRITPPLMELTPALQALGLKTAFDLPKGSADFDAMAPRKPDDYLSISKVLHKTFIEVDEKGTEAAAATAIVMLAGGMPARQEKRPPEVTADRPFLFAIQHKGSGACLFLGRVVDPR
jgi:serine protease inhibitor